MLYPEEGVCAVPVSVAWRRLVAASVLGRQLGDRHLDHSQLVGTGVGGCVARPQVPSECFAAVVEEAEHRVEPEPTFEVRCRSLLTFGVDLDQRRAVGHGQGRFEEPYRRDCANRSFPVAS